jgi:hypothetical protein
VGDTSLVANTPEYPTSRAPRAGHLPKFEHSSMEGWNFHCGRKHGGAVGGQRSDLTSSRPSPMSLRPPGRLSHAAAVGEMEACPINAQTSLHPHQRPRSPFHPSRRGVAPQPQNSPAWPLHRGPNRCSSGGFRSLTAKLLLRYLRCLVRISPPLLRLHGTAAWWLVLPGWHTWTGGKAAWDVKGRHGRRRPFWLDS